ncbi:hypothetical protein EX895_000478 [Sporisorium graminicola]|uniref:F-box domain-containing protein n=1 Tax=Sporisorium graminicola TaxID=280036 RepID=A0A4U7L114_9BASI|nr:hypothetical protein EX895_000478 [Sporisorium graminicola]TKY90480.1 hypothetical protein EX895_000478 [Sporisorium graminicola]
MHGEASRVGLLSLPPEILDSIASYAAMSNTSFASSSTSAPCSFLYDASLRSSKVVTPPTDLHALQLVCRRLYSLLSLESNPRLYARVFRSKFDTAAIGRRFGNPALTSHNLANELRRRCILLKRMRRCVATAAEAHSNDGVALFEDDESITEMLWLAYLMMLENDGLNYEQLCWAQLHSFLALHHASEMLDGAVQAGYPSDATHKALALHLIYLLTDPEQLAFEPKGEAVERLFVLRPFVFAAHKFDAFMAPWTLRNLPLTKNANSNDINDANGSVGSSGENGHQQPDEAAHQASQGGGDAPTLATNPFLADLTPRDRTCVVDHVGGQLRIAAPILAQGACFSFFMKVEKDPAVLGMTALSDPDDPSSETIVRQPAATRPPLSLTSADHDKDVSRLLSCLDPTRSPGLPPLFFRGMFEGIWEGRFSFFDFDSYREMLAGRMRSLYEGPFGEQPQIWKIKEKVVRLGPSEVEGGKGSLLAAGYTTSEAPQDSSASASATAAAAGGTTSMDAKGKSKALPQDWDRYPSFPDEDGRERYEILLSGTGHSAWGRFVVRGRVRTWDGMLIMTKEYRPDGRGKWLYRGYSVAGGKLVGRWRDTFTPDNMYGYEGCFLFQRRGGA